MTIKKLFISYGFFLHYFFASISTFAIFVILLFFSSYKYFFNDINIFLISFDSLRADRLYEGLYNKYPNLANFAQDSVLFNNCYSQASWTLPSHISLFTSQYPGIYLDYIDPSESFPISFYLPQKSLSIQRILHNYNFYNVNFNEGAFLSRKFGFDNGFDEFYSFDVDYAFTNACNFLNKNTNYPVFMFLHTYEPHLPWDRDYIYAGKYPESWMKGEDKMVDVKTYNATNFKCNTIEENDYLRNSYDGQILICDIMFGNFVNTLKKLNLYDNSLIIVFSDHGEDLGDQYLTPIWDHGHCLNEYIIKVPLIVKFPKQSHKGRNINSIVRLIDVAPTILDVLSLRVEDEMKGISLLHVMNGDADNLIAYSGWNYCRHAQYSVTDGRYKLIYTPEINRPLFGSEEKGCLSHYDTINKYQLFDIINDKLEINDISGNELDCLKKMIFLLNNEMAFDIPANLTNKTNLLEITMKNMHIFGINCEGLSPPRVESMVDDNTYIFEELQSFGYVK